MLETVVQDMPMLFSATTVFECPYTSQGSTMGNRSDCRFDDNLRTMLAQEAARLICDHGIDDYRNAKTKAAENLGLRNRGALPNNREIEAALAERNRIFGADRHHALLSQLRQVAVQVMHELHIFGPRLVGSVLSGNVTEHSPIQLHLFSDPPENVGMQLAAIGVQHSSMQQRLRLQRDSFERFQGYRFYAENCQVETTVFPERRNKHAPLSPLDGRPMRRAKLRDVQLLAGEA